MISRIAKDAAMNGLALKIKRLIPGPENFPIKDRVSIIGTVPKPKNVMYKTLSDTDPLAMDPANARYTKPQGRKPFTTPMDNKVSFDFFPNNSRNTFFVFDEYNDDNPDKASNFLKIAGSTIASSINTPDIIESGP